MTRREKAGRSPSGALFECFRQMGSRPFHEDSICHSSSLSTYKDVQLYVCVCVCLLTDRPFTDMAIAALRN